MGRIPHNKLKVEDIRKRIIDKFDNKLEIISIIDSKNIRLKSNVCGHEFSKSLQNVLKGKPICRDCAMRDRSKLHLTKEEFCRKYPEFNDNYKIVGYWINSQEKTMIECRKCCSQFNIRPYNVATHSSGCTKCGSYTKTKLDTLALRLKLEDTEFELLGECNSGNDIALFKHKTCGKEFYRKAGYFANKQACPDCRVKSSGEDKILKVLKEYNVPFKRECAFSDLRGTGGGYLRYDFGIYVEGKLTHFIEYDGKQHSEECNYNFFKDSFEKIQTHDRIKNEYCKDNNYILLRISHRKRRTVDKVVIEFLKEHKLIPSQAS